MIKNIFKLVFKESLILYAVKIISYAKDFIATYISQVASVSETERLRHETSLVWSEFIINHQEAFVSMLNFGMFLLSLWAIYLLITDGYKIIKSIKE